MARGLVLVLLLGEGGLILVLLYIHYCYLHVATHGHFLFIFYACVLLVIGEQVPQVREESTLNLLTQGCSTGEALNRRSRSSRAFAFSPSPLLTELLILFL